MSHHVGGILLSIPILIATAISIGSGRLVLRQAGAKRDDSPIKFWGIILVHLVLTVFFVRFSDASPTAFLNNHPTGS